MHAEVCEFTLAMNRHTHTGARGYVPVHTHTHTHTHTRTIEILLCCTISATGVVAGEQPQPSRPRMVRLGGEIAAKYWFSDMVLSHCW